MFGTNDYIYQELNLCPLNDFVPSEEQHDPSRQQMMQALMRQQQVMQMQPQMDYAALALQQQRMQQLDLQRERQRAFDEARDNMQQELQRLQRLREQSEQAENELARIRERRRAELERAQVQRQPQRQPTPQEIEAARQRLYRDVYDTDQPPEEVQTPETIQPPVYDETFETLPWSGAAQPAPIEVGE